MSYFSLCFKFYETHLVVNAQLTLPELIFSISTHELNQKAGFPAAWKIMENLENEKSIFQTWKNHGI